MKFSKKVGRTTKTENLAGGEAYTESPELELTSIALTSFLKDQFYRSQDDTLNRIVQLCEDIKDKKFIGQLACYSRNEFGMRSVSHVLAAELARLVKGEDWSKEAIYSIVRRPDDITEILAYYMYKYKKPIPNCLKKGLGKAFSRFNEYQLAKYRGEGNEFKLVDAVNLVHPKPTSLNKIALKKLIEGKLISEDTWESELTQAGQKAETEEDRKKLKHKAWKNLISERKIGYFALLRNLRNILQQAPDMIDEACTLLTDETMIANSLVLPFRFSTAFSEMQKLSEEGTRTVIKALNKAVNIATINVPKFPGKTLVVVDKSGSMGSPGDYDSPLHKASILAGCLIKSNDADLVLFAEDAEYFSVNPDDSILSLGKEISHKQYSGGTNLNAVFNLIKKPYNRIIVLSDMQSWVSDHTPDSELEQYVKRSGIRPFIFSIDLQGYGTLQFPEKKVACLAGYSEKIFNIMRFAEEDKSALLKTIRSIAF